MPVILADKNIPFLSEYIPGHIRVHYFDPDSGLDSHIATEDRNSVEAIVIRTVTRINAETFDPKSWPGLRFIGTASAGFDHVDVDYIREHGIAFEDAGGSNARAVGEFVTTAIMHWCELSVTDPTSLRVGIVGAGHTGTAVSKILDKLGIAFLTHDPPRESRDPEYISASIDDILKCDVITFHTPLVEHGEWSTRNWMDDVKLDRFHGKLIINAARGGVIDESSLVRWHLINPKQRKFVVDVWDGEPDYNPEVAGYATIATPHIAGYSVQSKRNATRTIVKKMFDALGINSPVSTMDCANIMSMIQLSGFHPMIELTERMKSGIGSAPSERLQLFRNLRVHTTLRNEYRFTSAKRFESLNEHPLIQRLIEACGGPA